MNTQRILSRAQELALPICVIASIFVILAPLPVAIMDLLLAANITVAVLVLLTTITVGSPAEFSVFPSLLLTTTLARLVLNVATTRLILTEAPTRGLEAAGGVVRGFGQYVAGNNEIVGFVIFAIIVAIQFLVITKGATRISEVAARFALDGLPGRQMTIDADLNAGLIDQAEAHQRRSLLAQQADFYAAMDGASKFVRGDAIAGLLITAINIVGGLAIGIFQHGMSIGQAAGLFTRLTIGDGLVSQIPALLISLAAGLLVTRSTRKSQLSTQVLQQLFSNTTALAVSAGFLGLLVFTQLPKLPLLVLGTGCVGLAIALSRHQSELSVGDEDPRTPVTPSPSASAADAKTEEREIENLLTVDPMELEIGVALIRMADPRRGGDLLAQINAIRKQIVRELGIVLPRIRIRDNLQLGDRQYRIQIHNIPVATGEIHPDRLLATPSRQSSAELDGIRVASALGPEGAVWIHETDRGRARQNGYQTDLPAAVLARHLGQVARKHASDLLTRDATKHLMDQLRKNSPAAVDELIPSLMKIGDVQRVLQLLLQENVPVRQLALILEVLGDHAGETKNPVRLVEPVRRRLARAITLPHLTAAGDLETLTLDDNLETSIDAALDYSQDGVVVRLPRTERDRISRHIARQLDSYRHHQPHPVLLVGPRIRAGVRALTSESMPELAVISHDELTPDIHLHTVGIVTEPRST